MDPGGFLKKLNKIFFLQTPNESDIFSLTQMLTGGS